jgi:hypothetical protein
MPWHAPLVTPRSVFNRSKLAVTPDISSLLAATVLQYPPSKTYHDFPLAFPLLGTYHVISIVDPLKKMSPTAGLVIVTVMAALAAGTMDSSATMEMKRVFVSVGPEVNCIVC